MPKIASIVTDGHLGAGDGEIGAVVFQGTYLTGIVLSNPATQNPATVAAGAYVTNNGTAKRSDAIFGTDTAAWSVTNYGTVEAKSLDGAGIYLQGGGTVTNAGYIAATGRRFIAGVHLAGPGSVANTGTITALGGTQGIAVYVQYGGNLSNAGTGLIAGSGVGAGLGNGRYGIAGTATNYGTIEGGSVGLLSKAPLTDIANFGSIADTGRHGYGVYLYHGGHFTNAASGQVSGYHGVWVTHAAATIVNGGAITATGRSGVGVELLSAGNTVVNAGTISGTGGAAFSFGNGNDLLVLDPGSVLQGAVNRFQPLETIDLVQIPATAPKFTGNAAYGTLTIFNGAAVVATFTLSGHFTTKEFELDPDGAGGTDIALKQPSGPVVSGVYYDTLLLGSGGEIGAAATVTASGTIDASFGHGVRAVGGAGSLTNQGTVIASETPRPGLPLSLGDGVYLNAGGMVANSGSTGLIAGSVAGVALGGGSGSVVNSGTIAGTGSVGVGILLGSLGVTGAAAAAGSPVEAATNYGTISGMTGIMAADGNATVTNAGVIIGYAGTAVALQGGGDRLVVDPGAMFQGVADGGGQSVLELAGPTLLGGHAAPSVGTLAGIGSAFVNFGTLVIDAGGAWEASGDGSRYQTVNDGTIIIADGIVAAGETLALGAVAADPGQSGVFDVGGNGFAQFSGAVAGTQTLVFTDATGVLQLAEPKAFMARIVGFQSGDVIDLVDQTVRKYSYRNGKLTLSETGQTVAVLTFAGHYAKADFLVGDDGNGGTIITLGAGSRAQIAAIEAPPVVFQGTYVNGIVLSNPATQNPATVAAGGYVTNRGPANHGDAVYGTDAAAWDLTNLGAVRATRAESTGVDLAAGGSVDNGSAAALVAGVTRGVEIDGAAGSVANLGTIEATGSSAYPAGVFLESRGGVGNYGAIEANGADGTGVFLQSGGAVANGSSATISAQRYGIWARDAAANVANYGMIRASDDSSIGIFLNNGGAVSNGESGASAAMIAGYAHGIAVHYVAGSVINSATIEASGAAASSALYFSGGGYLGNRQGGLIRGGDGARILGPGTVVDLGTIIGAGSYGTGLYLQGGDAMVMHGGAVQGGREGILIGGDGGEVINSGSIASTGGTGSAIGFYSAGVVENAAGGLLTGQFGVAVNGPGTVHNLGIIAGISGGGYGVVLGAGGSVVNGAGASISGGSLGIKVLAGAATVTNYGGIAGGYWGLLIEAGGTVGNAAGGVISGYLGIALGGAPGTVTNAGTIIGAAGGAGAAFSFGNGEDLLVVEPRAVFAGAIARFQPLETIDLAGLSATAAGFVDGTLTLLNGGTIITTLALSGQFAASEFALAGDGRGGTDITLRQPAQPVLGGVYYDTVLLGASAIGSSATVTASGTIEASFGHGVRAVGGVAGSLTNAGTVIAAETPRSGLPLSLGDGVYLNAGGLVENAGVIAGSVGGIALGGGSGSVVNWGTIAGTGPVGVGILLGSVGLSGAAAAVGPPVEAATNYGTISGMTGIVAAGGNATVTNAGVIIGYAGTAVALQGGGDRLVVDPGAMFQGVADGGGQSVLELAGPTLLGGHAAPSVGTLAGIGSSFVNFGTLIIDAGGAWEASGDGSRYQTVNDGTIIIADGIVAAGETLALGAVAADRGQSGVFDLGGNGVADFSGAVARNQALVFTDAAGVLQLAEPKAFMARIVAFQSGDVIDLVGQTVGKYTYRNGKLTLSEAGRTVAVLSFTGHYTKSDFQIGDDGNGGTDIALAAAGVAAPIASGAAAASGTIFGGTYKNGIVLSNPATQNPATIAASAYVTNASTVAYAAAVLGEPGFAWTVANLGTVAGGGTSHDGIVLLSGGTVTNGATGAGTALIEAGHIGVAIRGSAGQIGNFGTIESSSKTTGGGAWLPFGGTLVNGGTSAAGALITAYRFGVYAGGNGGHHYAGATATIINYGTIASTSAATAHTAVLLVEGGAVANAGLIESAAGPSVYIAGGPGTVVNYGTIASTSTAMAHTTVVLVEGGAVANAGLIGNAAGAGVYIAGGAGTVLNTAIIHGDIDLLAGGFVVNSAGGLIAGSAQGIFISGGSGTVANDGAIAGGVYLETAGTVVNYGAVNSPEVFGVGLQGSSNLVNSGTITATGVLVVDGTNHYGTGVFLDSSGTVRNDGTIAVGVGGIGIASYGIGSVINYGFVETGSYGFGIALEAGNVTTFTNRGTVVAGDAGIGMVGGTGSVVNYGLVEGALFGILLQAGTVTNNGTIRPSGDGAGIGVEYGYALNYGTIIATNLAALVEHGTFINRGVVEGSSYGIRLGQAAGAALPLTNAAAYVPGSVSIVGTVTGGVGIASTAGGAYTLGISGTVVGTGGTAVSLGPGANLLQLEPGAVFQGIVSGGGRSVLELAGPTLLGGHAAPSVGTLAGIGSAFVNFGTLVVDGGAAWEASGDASNYPLVNDGTIIIADNIVAAGETLALGAVAADPGQSGVFDLGSNGVGEFSAAVDETQTLVFTDAAGVLQLADPKAFMARIVGFQSGDVIDLVGQTVGKYTYRNGKLTLSEAGHRVAVLSFAGHYAKSDFQIGDDGNGGTMITFAGSSLEPALLARAGA